MKKLSSLLLALLTALPLLALTSCEMGGGRIDLVNPTVQQMDQFDVSNGLPARKSRSGSSRFSSGGGSSTAPSGTVDPGVVRSLQ